MLDEQKKGKSERPGVDPWSLLACPNCQSELGVHWLQQGRGQSSSEGLLICRQCRGWYPITKGIPRLVIPGPLRSDDEAFLTQWSAQIEALGLGDISLPQGHSDDAGKEQVQSSFGHKWTRQTWWGIEGESAEVMEEWLLPRYGWSDRACYQAFLSPFRAILDAGCGLGRETLRMAQANPNACVIGLELSECVDVAADHARTKNVTNAFYVQADLSRPPLKTGSFDFIFSEGVLHHTPDTRQSFLALVPLLSKRGEIAFYVYRKKAPLREFTDDYIRSRIQDLDPDTAWSLMKPLTQLGKTLAELKVTIDVREDIEVLGIKAGRYDLQRLIHYSMFKCFWNERLTFDENVLINFDWYHPRYAWRHTREDVRAWLEEAGLTVVHETIDESGITVRATKNG